jgi:hypothetical protein
MNVLDVEDFFRLRLPAVSSSLTGMSMARSHQCKHAKRLAVLARNGPRK